MGGESSVDILVSLLGIGLSASLLETHGSWEGGSKKLYVGVFKGGKVRETFTSMLL